MNLLANIFLLKNIYRKSVLISIDMLIIFLSINITFWITNKELTFFNQELRNYSLFLIIISSILLYSLSGQYKAITRYLGSRSVYINFVRNFFILLLIQFFVSNLESIDFSLKESILLWFLISSITSIYRFFLRDFILLIREKVSRGSKLIAIYGAGKLGAQLLSSFKMSNKYKVILFVDDDKNLQGRLLNGIKVISPKNLHKYNDNLFGVFIALPNITKEKLTTILNKNQNLGLKTFEIPEAEYLTNELLNLKRIKPILIEDLLYRSSIPPNKKILKNSIKDKIICITGAGGSIGSELCRQIINFNPSKVLLIELNEQNLYDIDNELQLFNSAKVIPILGDCCNKEFIRNILKEHKIDLLIHAAAYKHVPLVESNPINGIANNVFGTKIVCEAAFEFNIERFVLISSDKAVRPKNIMGASKRVSELIVQAYAKRISMKEESEKKEIKYTKFSMVRFGNVLNSSGSVVPLFKKQIKNGGPITLTDNNITRYFMTIKEAAQLVLQAAELSEGGELFLLDMGQPIKIRELAKQMIKLSGLSLKDKDNPNGDIEIKITGLRPGEKLYEELLIDAKSEKTQHKLIYKAKEKMISFKELMENLNKLENNLIKLNKNEVLDLMSELVPEWRTK